MAYKPPKPKNNESTVLTTVRISLSMLNELHALKDRLNKNRPAGDKMSVNSLILDMVEKCLIDLRKRPKT